ncbi:MAG: hypothetical protein H7Z73_12595 [Candidatus Saccharibacteria bacterium]|nr:hypothetical protein [Moraxellaceae bacterium]
MLPNNSPLEYLTAFAIVFVSGAVLAMSITYCATKRPLLGQEKNDESP